MSELTREELEAIADEIRPPRAKGVRKVHVEQTERHIDRQLRIVRERSGHPQKPARPPREVGKFWAKVRHGGVDECWPWTGYTVKSGHGLTQLKGLSMYASRKAYILTHGEISSDFCVNHRCDRAICCNPAHLYLGTRADNMIDRFAKTPADERTRTGRNRILTDEQIEVLWQMRRADKSLKECAEKFGVHIATICRYITARRKVALEKMQARRHTVPLAK